MTPLRLVGLLTAVMVASGATLAARAMGTVHDVHQYGRAFLLVRLDIA